MGLFEKIFGTKEQRAAALDRPTQITMGVFETLRGIAFNRHMQQVLREDGWERIKSPALVNNQPVWLHPQMGCKTQIEAYEFNKLWNEKYKETPFDINDYQELK